MALRLMEIAVPAEKAEAAKEILGNEEIVSVWKETETGGRILIQVIVAADKAEPIMDTLEQRFSGISGFSLLLLPVEARIPQPKAKTEAPPIAVEADEEKTQKAHRVSRAELYSEISEGANTSSVFMAMVVLSSLVASVGLLQDNVAVVIGAMVIAPLLGPSAALALATTLGDMPLIRQALRAQLVGILLAFIVSFGIGLGFEVDAAIAQIASRTRVGLGDIILALSSGGAGALAFTTGLPTAVIGVMMAVALLPPLVTFGLLLGSGQVSSAFGALLLLVVNLICINLAGVCTFLIQGLRPRTWWEAERAKRASRVAIMLWALLLLILVVVLILAQAKQD